MSPAFTTDRRKNAFYNDTDKGIHFVSWHIEEELQLFQREIEFKFKASLINGNYKYPLQTVTFNEVNPTDNQKVYNIDVVKKA